MRSKSSNFLYTIDWPLIFLYLALSFLGWLNVYSVTITEDSLGYLNLSTEYGKQLLWILISLFLGLLLLALESRVYEYFSYLGYLFTLVLLASLFLFGTRINGATSWFTLGPINIQPSEFAKIFTALVVSKTLSDSHFNINSLKNLRTIFLIIFIPAALICFQPDYGSALVYLAFLFVLYREGLHSSYILIPVGAIILFITTLIVGREVTLIAFFIIIGIIFLYVLFYRFRLFIKIWYRLLIIGGLISLFVFSVDFMFNELLEQRHRDRINILLNKTEDLRGIGYNQYQSEQAIASGRFSGKGFLEGERTQGAFVPEQQTDYIFTTVGEEWGFIGSGFVLLLFTLLLLRIINLAERQKQIFKRAFGYSVASILFVHVAINIGMVLGLLPTIGIPLPFFSYGGSSYLSFTIMLFVFIRLSSER